MLAVTDKAALAAALAGFAFNAAPRRKVPGVTRVVLEQPGKGKSTRALRQIAASDEHAFIFVQNLKLARQTKSRLINEFGVPERDVVIDYGHTAKISGKYICVFGDVAEKIQKAGGASRDMCQKGKKTCDHATHCSIHKARHTPARVRIAAHGKAPYSAPSVGRTHEGTRAGFLIFDEDPLSSLVRLEQFALDVLMLDMSKRLLRKHFAAVINKNKKRKSGKPYDGPGTASLVAGVEQITKVLHETAKTQAAHIEYINACRPTVADLGPYEPVKEGRLLYSEMPSYCVIRGLRRIIERMQARPKVEPNPKDTEALKERAKANMPMRRAIRFLEALEDRLKSSTGSDRIVYGMRLLQVKKRDGKVGFEVEVATLQPVHEDYYSDTTMVLSATASPILLKEALFEEVHEEGTEAWEQPDPKYVKVTRYHTKSGISHFIDQNTKQLTGRVADVQALIDFYGHRYKHRKVLVVCQKALVKHLKSPHENVDIKNFGAVEGSNNWEDAAAVLIVGRPLPPMSALWMRVEAIGGESIEIYSHPNLNRWPFRTITPAHGYPISHPTHENPLMQALIAATMIAALVQAERTRAIHRGADNPCEIVLVNDVIFPFEEHRVLPLGAIPGWFTVMLDGGVCIAPPQGARGGALARDDRTTVLQYLVPELAHRDGDLTKGAENLKKKLRGLVSRGGVSLDDLCAGPFFDSRMQVGVRLPGRTYWTELIVNAQNHAAAEKHLRGLLPEGTEYKPRSQRRTITDQGKCSKSAGG